MSLISVHDITKAYASERVLDGVTLQVYAGEKVGFVGANGTGKTTLLRIMAGEVQPDSGGIIKARSATVAYLAQEAALRSDRTLRAEAEDALSHLRSMQSALQAVQEQMAETSDADELTALTHQHDKLHEEFQRSGGYDYERRIEVVLEGVGFRREDFDMPVPHMSGGQRSRAALGKLLLQAPDLMLLDEPTNHLDVHGIEWLEAYLGESAAGALVVSHDRYFLDRMATRIVELERGKLAAFPGNYSAYARVKAERIERQRKEYEAQQQEIAKQKDYIRRYHYGQRAREARGRQKKLDRMVRLEKPAEQRTLHIRAEATGRAGDIVVTAQGLTKRFGDLTLFADLDLEIARGDRLGIIGPNGSGKTTLLRILMGHEPASQGSVQLGTGISIGYYEQDLAGLDPSRTILDELWEVNRQATEQELRDVLGAYLFSGDEVEREIGALSGGEQCRVALAKLMLRRPNALVLDEPTNHLDIPSRTALEAALLHYRGTIIMVSHDRYFLNQIAHKVLWIENGRTQLYHGDYDFVQRTRKRDAQPAAPAQTHSKRDAYRERQRAQRRAKANKSPYAKLSFGQIEQAIVEKEDKLGALQTQMADPAAYADGDKVKTLRAEYETVAAELAALNKEWQRRVEEM